VAGAVVAGGAAGGHDTFAEATAAMTGIRPEVFEPIPAHRAVYDRLYALYRTLHDAFGVPGASVDLYAVMKTLLDERDAALRGPVAAGAPTAGAAPALAGAAS
jgi:L-ribulokinase